MEIKEKPYMNPYLAGIGLGLVLLAAFVLMGRGLGVSGAMASITTAGVEVISSEHVKEVEFYRSYLNGENSPLYSWIVFEIFGLLLGAFASAKLAGRIKPEVMKGAKITVNIRYGYAFTGGALMGFGAMLGRGCTSGQALTGGALLNVGSWMFMICIFIGGYAMAWFVRRAWT